MLDLAVEAVLGPLDIRWHVENDPAASRVLAHRFPGVPNHGDLTAVDWTTVEPVAVLAAGWPCTSASVAGKREGLREGTPTGLWRHVARCIATIRPKLV